MDCIGQVHQNSVEANVFREESTVVGTMSPKNGLHRSGASALSRRTAMQEGSTVVGTMSRKNGLHR
jgi:hypothetical protein